VRGSYRAGKKILWMMWTLRRPVRQDDPGRQPAGPGGDP